MASNSYIFSHRTTDSLHLKLDGDFDGNSVHELINTLEEHGKDFYQIFVETNDLKNVYPFGKDVFQKQLDNLEKQFRNLIFTGVIDTTKSSAICPSKCGFRFRVDVDNRSHGCRKTGKEERANHTAGRNGG